MAIAVPMPVPPLPLPPPPTASGLTPGQQRAIVIGTIAAHVAAGWGLLQIDAVRQAVVEAAPIFVSLVPPAPPTPLPPTPPQPAPKTPLPKIPLIAAAPTPTPTPTQPVFVAEPAPPLPPEILTPAPPAPPVPPAPPAPVPQPKQIPPSAVRYTKLPDLNFPLLARRARQGGTVVLRITVDTAGQLKSVRVEKSSGFERIDQAALTDIRTARFAPYMEDGKPIEVQTLATLGYDL